MLDSFRVMVTFSLASRSLSGLGVTMRVALEAPAGMVKLASGFRLPEPKPGVGRTLPVKSLPGVAESLALVAASKLTTSGLVVATLRVNTKRRLCPPFSFTEVGVSRLSLTSGRSSLMILFVAVVLVGSRATPDGELRVTLKASLSSTAESPFTLTVIVLLRSLRPKEMVPEGKKPPTKSSALAGVPPDPATVQLALQLPDRSLPLRETVKMYGVVFPPCPSLIPPPPLLTMLSSGTSTRGTSKRCWRN